MRMHTNAPGEIGDTWSWRATTTDPAGHADDNYWDEVGRKPDSETDFVSTNRRALDGGASLPLFMSEEGVNANPSVLWAPDAGRSPRAVPFDAEDLEPGARLPGFVLQRASPRRDDIRAAGRWRNGKWTVELSRRLVTGDPNDVQFPLQ
jgi:hypothetical protein